MIQPATKKQPRGLCGAVFMILYFFCVILYFSGFSLLLAGLENELVGLVWLSSHVEFVLLRTPRQVQIPHESFLQILYRLGD